MNERDKELAEEAGLLGPSSRVSNAHASAEKFANLIRADEREAFVAFIQEYPHWLGDNAKQEIIAAIRARGNT